MFHRPLLILALVTFFPEGCFKGNVAFTQEQRETYNLQASELEGLQFYVSRRVVAKDLANPDSPSGVFILPEGTAGIAKEAGANWLRVSFDEGGAGVLFVARTELEDGYWLATASVNGNEMRRIKDGPERVLRLGDRRFDIVEGATAYLVVREKDLDALIEQRRHATGRTVAP